MAEKTNDLPNDGYVCMQVPNFLGDGDSSPSWEKLQQVEARRRAILKRVELPFYRVIFFWDGTCLKVLVKDALMWISLIIYGLVRYYISKVDDLPQYLIDLDDSNIDIIGGFLSFFLVLFVNQANTRFFNMYFASMAAKERIEDVANVLACHAPQANANRIIRYLNAAHAAGYVGLASQTYTTRSFFMELNKRHKLLTEKELERIYEIGIEDNDDSAMKELLVWVIRDLKVLKDQDIIDGRMNAELRGSVQKFRESMSHLYSHQDQPIHFFYVHFLSLLTALYLPLFAVTTAYGVGGGGENGFSWTSETVTALIVFLQAVFVIGLRLLGQVMVDPYGEDLEDLSVLHYIQSTWTSSNRILAAHSPAVLDPTVEEENMKMRESIGGVWDGFSTMKLLN